MPRRTVVTVWRVGGTSDLGHASCAVWRRATALEALSVGRVDALVRAGVWQVPWPGVLADGGYVLDPVQRAWAAVLASGADTRSAAYACGRTAARVWGLPLVDDDDPATGARDGVHDDVGVRVNRGGDVVHGDRTLHRHQLRLRPGDLQQQAGLRLTSPLRTLADLSLLVTHEALVCCLDDALHRGLVSPEDLDAAVLLRKGRRNGPALRRAVELADGRAEAPSETLLRLLLRPRFPDLEPQVVLIDAAARPLARFDLGDRDARVAVEVDGRRGHAGSELVAKDRRRDRSARRHGWTTERVTWFDVRRRPSEVVERVAEVYAEQLRRSASPRTGDQQGDHLGTRAGLPAWRSC